MKIELDKYYTPIETANHCYDKVIELIGTDNITEIVEPSVGNGSFLHHPFCKARKMTCIDIKPEISGNNVFTSDWLTYPIEYKQGRLIIGNPP